MKRKFFSALLLMTLSVASVGMLVSCKDYDDDINSVRDDVTNLRSELETMRTSLTEELNAAKTELETQISDAKTQLQAAIDGKADQATVTALEARVATLEGDLAALKSTYEAKIAQIDEAMASYSEDIEGIKNTLATLTAADGDIAKLKERIVFSTDKDLRYYLMQYIEQHGSIEPRALNQWKFVPEEWVVPAARRDYGLLFGAAGE